MHARPTVALSLSLVALIAGCSAATDDAAPDGDAAEATAERGEELTLAASMAWAEPADATVGLIPGPDNESVDDPAPASGEVFRVLVDPQPNTQNGTIRVSQTWDAAPATCANRSLSVRALAQTAGTIGWAEIKEVDVTSVAGLSGGEFPQAQCRASVSIPFAPNVARVRVMSQARTRLFFNGQAVYSYASTTVTASGTSPAPDLNASIIFDPDGAANALVTNDGPVTATAVDADINYEYDYCPPAQGGEPDRCNIANLPTGTCRGAFCGPGTFVGVHRAPIRCSWTKDFPQVEIGANGGVLNWVWHQPGVQARCGLCVPGGYNRCANAITRVTARELTSPFDLMTPATDDAQRHGVL